MPIPAFIQTAEGPPICYFVKPLADYFTRASSNPERVAGWSGLGPKPHAEAHRVPVPARCPAILDAALVDGSGYTQAYGLEPWSYDGTTLRMIADIVPGPRSSSPDTFIPLGGDLYFRAWNVFGDAYITSSLMHMDGESGAVTQIPGVPP